MSQLDDRSLDAVSRDARAGHAEAPVHGGSTRSSRPTTPSASAGGLTAETLARRMASWRDRLRA